MNARAKKSPDFSRFFGSISYLFCGFKKMANHSDKLNMKAISKKNQAESAGVQEKKTVLPEEYINETVRDYSFSNFVRLTTNQTGMLFSFGKIHPKESKILIFDEILLPFEVAESLSRIIRDQFEKLQKQGLVELIPAKHVDEKGK